MSPVEVLQPHAEGACVCVMLDRVTYFGYFGEGATEASVRLTCEPYQARVIGGIEQGDFNAASTAGLKVRFEYPKPTAGKPGRWWGLFGDTMRVVLDATSLRGSVRRVDGVADTALVAATVQCLIVNAARYGQVPMINVQVLGPKGLQRFGGTFGTEGYECGPKKRIWP